MLDIPLERLVENSIPVPEAGCHLWLLAPTNRGYGTLSYRGKEVAAHRAAWSVHNHREIPRGMCVLHKCDTPLCVNPLHLRLGTQSENMADRDRKGRARFNPGPRPGVKGFAPLLSRAQVAEIARASGTHKHIAARFGVSVGTVCNAKHGRIKNFTDEGSSA